MSLYRRIAILTLTPILAIFVVNLIITATLNGVTSSRVNTEMNATADKAVGDFGAMIDDATSIGNVITANLYFQQAVAINDVEEMINQTAPFLRQGFNFIDAIDRGGFFSHGPSRRSASEITSTIGGSSTLSRQASRC